MTLFYDLVGLLFVSSFALASQGFSYDGEHGPLHWGKQYNTCVGKHQSPINIEEHIVKNVSLSPLRFFGMDVVRPAYLTNNGHTVMLKMNSAEPAGVSGGPLGHDDYVFEQLHFHWGANDHEGSEDLINNHSFAMEMHVVLYKRAYGSMASAVNHSDGLAVLAYFFEASEEDNPIYKSIVDTLPTIEGFDSATKLQVDFVIREIFMPKTELINDYFTYNGSLTTPPCSEVVTWIDFKNALPLSHKQIAAFRDVRSSEGVKLTHNFRPVQPLEDRVIYHNIVNVTKNGDSNVWKPTESNEIGSQRSGQSGIVSSVAPYLLGFGLVADLAVPLVTPFFGNFP